MIWTSLAASLPLASATVDVWAAIKANDYFGFACLAILAGLSIWSTTIIVLKWRQIGTASSQTTEFLGVVNEDGTWDELFRASKEYPESPLARLLKETYVECRLENWFSGNAQLALEGRLEVAKRTIEGILLRTITEEESRLQKQLSLLSTTSTLAPFLGLLGTVWGVLAAFQALSDGGSAGIANLAPGISTALMTTIAGLFAAIPALVCYNKFMADIHQLSARMETFSQELENAVRKQILQGGGTPE